MHGCTSKSSVINQSWSTQSPLHGQLVVSLRHAKRLVICKFQSFCLFDIQQWLVLSLRSYEMVFHALFVCGHYFVQYWFIEACIFYRFFWESSFLFFFMLFWIVSLNWIQCNPNKLYNICCIIMNVYKSIRYSVCLFSLTSEKRYAS